MKHRTLSAPTPTAGRVVAGDIDGESGDEIVLLFERFLSAKAPAGRTPPYLTPRAKQALLESGGVVAPAAGSKSAQPHRGTRSR